MKGFIFAGPIAGGEFGIVEEKDLRNLNSTWAYREGTFPEGESCPFASFGRDWMVNGVVYKSKRDAEQALRLFFNLEFDYYPTPKS